MNDGQMNIRPFLDEAGRLTALPAKHRKKLPELEAFIEAYTGGGRDGKL